jgi:pimeloyl-ACP methyl ester carboxylesterase
MAKIVAIHGIGQQNKGENSLRLHWLPALRDGLARTGKTLGRDDDLVCAFYGDLFRPKGKAIQPPYTASDVAEWESSLLQKWWEAGVDNEPSLPTANAHTKVRTPEFAQRALNALSRHKYFKNVAEQAMIYDLKQVRIYMNDDTVRASTLERVRQHVGEETRVIIGHSLGSVVAYEALCAHPEWPVEVLVTLGSPLGIRNLIFDSLRPPPTDGVGAWPGSIKFWTNLSDRGDVVATVKKLGDLFRRKMPGFAVMDVLVDNGATAHDVEPYLTAKETGDAISLGL